ncbi:MAG: hypothetical protein PVI01_17535 [Gemmatimonadales bacterium]|jgi:hypothetical protein
MTGRNDALARPAATDRQRVNRSSVVAAIAIALASGLPTIAAAQQEPAPEEAAPPDTLFTPPPLSPGGAFFRSLVLPGWAQSELGAETRGAFYFLAESFSLFMVARTQVRLDWAERTRPADSGLIESRKQQREDWIALAVFTAFFAAADGWVSVHLFGFDERTDLKPEDVAIGVGWKIPVGP